MTLFLSGTTWRETRLRDGRTTYVLEEGKATVKSKFAIVWPPEPQKLIRLDGTIVYREFDGTIREATEDDK